MVEIIIKSEKQSNGLWGIPFRCYNLSRIPSLSHEDHVKLSAILTGIAEQYPNERFEFYWATGDVFLGDISNVGPKFIRLKDYELDGNRLIWNEQLN